LKSLYLGFRRINRRGNAELGSSRCVDFHVRRQKAGLGAEAAIPSFGLFGEGTIPGSMQPRLSRPRTLLQARNKSAQDAIAGSI